MNKGFTLIEVFLAIAILAVVGTLVYGGFSQTALNKARVEQSLDHYRVVNMTLERMARELSMAFVSTHINPSPVLQFHQTAFIGTDDIGGDRVDFTSFSHRRLYRDSHESDQNEISYFVTEHPDDAGIRVLARREQNRIDEDPRQGGKSQILVEGVEGFDIDYYDPLLNDWVRTWDTTQINGQPNRLPTQVRIRLEVQDPQRPGTTQVFATRAMLPLQFGLNHANYNP